MIDFILHLDQHLSSMVATLGPWTLVVLFLVVFCETGLVVTPFLPGDSLLFATGAVSALEPRYLPLPVVLGSLFFAAVFGDFVNAEMGRRAGPRLLGFLSRRPGGEKSVKEASLFFERYGARAIVLARFLPLLRTFVPFVAGLAGMNRTRFTLFNIIGGAAWVGSLVTLGYVIGDVPAVKSRFHLLVLGIILVSVAPVLIEIVRHARRPSRTP